MYVNLGTSYIIFVLHNVSIMIMIMLVLSLLLFGIDACIINVCVSGGKNKSENVSNASHQVVYPSEAL